MDLMPVLLTYNVEEKKLSQIRALCTKEGVARHAVGAEYYLEPIGALVGVPGMACTGCEYEGPGFAEEMLLFNGFDNQALTRFLTQYREAGIAKISLKATVTPHNLSWNSLQLRDELKREYDELMKNG